jgi:ammonium transporter, Amt family
LTGIFAQSSVAGFDGIAQIPGGWLDHHYIQLAIQLAASSAGMSYSFVMTVRFFFFFLSFFGGDRLTCLLLSKKK